MRLDAHGKTFPTISLSEYNDGKFAVGWYERIIMRKVFRTSRFFPDERLKVPSESNLQIPSTRSTLEFAAVQRN